MNLDFSKIGKVNKNYYIYAAKVFAILLVSYIMLSNFFIGRINSCYSYKDYNHKNELSEAVFCNGNSVVVQTFKAKGNILSHLKLYFTDAEDTELTLELLNEKSGAIHSITLNTVDYSPMEWNTIDIDCHKLIRGRTYQIRIAGNDLGKIALTASNSNPEIFETCYVNGEAKPHVLAVELQSTYRYMTFGSCLELFVELLFVIIINLFLSYAVLNVEKLVKGFRYTNKCQGILYTLYFTVYTVLFFNPMDSLRTEVKGFDRIIGTGLISGDDVSKRISNFNYWFICLAVFFVLFYLLANYFKTKQFSEENKMMIKFLDNLIILANVILGIKCISYFYHESLEVKFFDYSENFIISLILMGFVYILLDLEKKINVEQFIKLLVSSWMLSYPLAILLTNSKIIGKQEWGAGQNLLGVQIILLFTLLISARFVNINWKESHISLTLTSIVICLSFLPFYTSFFIELVTILNQHEIFLVSIASIYFSTIIIGFLLIMLFTVYVCKKNIQINNWKKISYPVIVFGVACLWRQTAITGTYMADLYESANSSILISDFLNFGNIPIVEHYGGHMMTGVWEGIIYGLANNDYFGAVFSPYSLYVSAVIAVLFFFLVKHIWEENIALLVTLVFPFYNSVGTWGLGLLMCFAVMAYVKKNTYVRGALFWLAFVWCTLYRLDLGFAFAFACISSLALYIIIEKNMKAVKQLVISMLAVGGVMLIFWCLLCMLKGIHPFLRLFEFLLISASNQNWAWEGLGDTMLSMYAWSYIFIPFAVVMCLVYIMISKPFRERIGRESWVLLFVLGFSFLFNYSRGLVRHSVVETALTVIMWTAYVFLAMFVTSLINNRKLFLPVFFLLVLCNGLFLSDYNFAERSIADCSVDHIGDFVETWRPGRFAEEELTEGENVKSYWAQLKENREVITRVKVDEELTGIVYGYQLMMDTLLGENETFVDFINKSFVYSAIGRQSPVYAAQSPLHLSGEFTQEEFVKEIKGIPVVLMPIDPENYWLSESLDDIANSVRYYKVAEYIYQNYVPLCAYEDDFAIWCLPERYDEMSRKVMEISSNRGIEIKDSLVWSEDVFTENAEIISNSDGSVNINYTGFDPHVCELQNMFDFTPYINGELKVAIEYQTNVDGVLQMFYTTDEYEDYTEEKMRTAAISGEGTAYFTIPITEWSHLRLDTPEGSQVKIQSFRMGACSSRMIDYGYDGPYLAEDGLTYNYLPYLHNYNVNKLPYIWAQGDKKNSTNNVVVATAEYINGLYKFDLTETELGTEGNYLKLKINYTGNDTLGKYMADDETTNAYLKAGKYSNGKFETKYVYNFTIKEGMHEYMFRISNDYYWYLKQINSVMIESTDNLINVDIDILEGD